MRAAEVAKEPNRMGNGFAASGTQRLGFQPLGKTAQVMLRGR